MQANEAKRKRSASKPVKTASSLLAPVAKQKSIQAFFGQPKRPKTTPDQLKAEPSIKEEICKTEEAIDITEIPSTSASPTDVL